MKIICGLGNPGPKYDDTRHNVGFAFIDELAKRWGAGDFTEKWDALYAEVNFEGEKLLLVKPLTFMNLSGKAVEKFMNFYKVDSEDLIVVYDDVDLDFGQLRYRDQGSAGTHNGMKSIVENLGSSDFPRLRIGIESRGKFAPEQMDLSSFVLARFEPEEQERLDGVFDEGVDLLTKQLA